MNEELQSTNEEMHAVNEELHERSDEVRRVNTYLEAILTSMQSGVVVVDRDVLVRMWNSRSEDLWGLRADEVRGKNFLNLDIGLPVEELRGPIREVLEAADGRREEEVAAIDRRGRPVTCRISIAPLTHDGEGAGAILLVDL